jgi:F-type H+-transporting ATPase subunit a
MAAEHYNYLQFIPRPELQKFTGAIILAGVILAVGSALAARINTPEARKQALVPSAKLGIFSLFEFMIESFIKYYESILGKGNREHLPLTAGIFLFILSANLLGLFPGMPAITTTVWVTAALAIVSFVYFNVQGVRANGLLGYLKHFAGPVWWFSIVLFPLELLSTSLRAVTLNMRLYWNITADHIVLSQFTSLLGWGFQQIGMIVFYVMGTFVSFVQAFIFTTLSLVYILLATQHEDEQEHSH